MIRTIGQLCPNSDRDVNSGIDGADELVDHLEQKLEKHGESAMGNSEAARLLSLPFSQCFSVLNQCTRGRGS